jgi:hypothetical protein
MLACIVGPPSPVFHFAANNSPCFSNRDKGRCSDDQLVNTLDSVGEAVNCEEVFIDENHKVPPAMFSRTFRGGKTTFIQLLHLELVRRGFCPISITLNSGSTLPFSENDTTKQKLIKLIASNFFIDPSAAIPWCVTEKEEHKLLQHIENTCGSKKVVLLIDELSNLIPGIPLDIPTSEFLIKNFLDKVNRYLIFTTHIPMTSFDLFTNSVSRMSEREVCAINPPFCFAAELINHMPNCNTVTPAQIAFYGGIPSLIYFINKVNQHDQFNPQRRFEYFIRRNPLQENKIPDFVRCVLNGERRAGLQTMDRFSSMIQDENGFNIVTFPLCYIKYFCE